MVADELSKLSPVVAVRARCWRRRRRADDIDGRRFLSPGQARSGQEELAFRLVLVVLHSPAQIGPILSATNTTVLAKPDGLT